MEAGPHQWRKLWRLGGSENRRGVDGACRSGRLTDHYMNNHRIGLWALVLAWVGWSAAGIAQIPEGYYAGVDDSTPQTLRSTLHATLKAGHVVRSYNNAIQTIQDANQDPNNSNNIILIYSGISVSKTWDSGNTWNREHVFPQSHFNSNSPYVSDVHALMPTVPTINSRRG